MKKIYFLLCVSFFLVSFASAQISKGSLWLGGDIGFASGKNQTVENSKSTSYSFSPSIGKAVKQNTILGLQTSFYHYHSEASTPFGESTGSYIAAGIFVRQYWEIINRFYVYGHFSGWYSATHQTDTIQSYKTNSKGWSIGLGVSPGLAFSVNNWLQLEAGFYSLFSVGYSGKTNHLTSPGAVSSYKSHAIAAGINLENATNFNVGFRFLIKR